MNSNIDQFIEIYLNGGNKKASVGDEIGAFESYIRALSAMLNKAAKFDDLSDGIQNLRTPKVLSIVEVLKKYFRTHGGEIGKQTFGPGMKPSVGVVNALTLSHLLWLLEERVFGEMLIEAVTKPPFTDQITSKLWAEYIRAFACLVRKQAYEPKVLKLKGIEKHWATYLPLISDLTNQRPGVESLKQVTESFDQMNRDKRIIVSGPQPEPNGQHPVKWDFRLEAIRWYAAQAYGVQF